MEQQQQQPVPTFSRSHIDVVQQLAYLFAHVEPLRSALEELDVPQAQDDVIPAFKAVVDELRRKPAVTRLESWRSLLATFEGANIHLARTNEVFTLFEHWGVLVEDKFANTPIFDLTVGQESATILFTRDQDECTIEHEPRVAPAACFSVCVRGFKHLREALADTFGDASEPDVHHEVSHTNTTTGRKTKGTLECKKYVWALPRVLFIHLNRIERSLAYPDGDETRRPELKTEFVNSYLAFDTTLDMAPYCHASSPAIKKDAGKTTYKLAAICAYAGEREYEFFEHLYFKTEDKGQQPWLHITQKNMAEYCSEEDAVRGCFAGGGDTSPNGASCLIYVREED